MSQLYSNSHCQEHTGLRVPSSQTTTGGAEHTIHVSGAEQQQKATVLLVCLRRGQTATCDQRIHASPERTGKTPLPQTTFSLFASAGRYVLH
ncbi:hypothetical protein CHARACLAT_021538 [Characodon lateralis]|uniref:Uncharacterized protein n=1 Tax=Characodon lateralis TaxID=208331 RepID=A0ABU7E2B0_9TELE|nr:hypothetical protein [Characodon lateralis]